MYHYISFFFSLLLPILFVRLLPIAAYFLLIDCWSAVQCMFCLVQQSGLRSSMSLCDKKVNSALEAFLSSPTDIRHPFVYSRTPYLIQRHVLKNRNHSQ